MAQRFLRITILDDITHDGDNRAQPYPNPICHVKKHDWILLKLLAQMAHE
jgi:hypothetical protein